MVSVIAFPTNCPFLPLPNSRLQVVALQAGSAENLLAWKTFCDTSRKMFREVYGRLDVTLTECGESFYNPLLPGVVAELQEKGLLEDSEGAQVMWLPDFAVPLMVRKGDGGYGYDSTDMAAIKCDSLPCAVLHAGSLCAHLAVVSCALPIHKGYFRCSISHALFGIFFEDTLLPLRFSDTVIRSWALIGSFTSRTPDSSCTFKWSLQLPVRQAGWVKMHASTT